MQAQAAASCFAQPLFLSKPAANTNSKLQGIRPGLVFLPRRATSAIKASSPVAYELDNQTFDYNSTALSVFPAEACETVGGEACTAYILPEAKIEQEAASIRTGSANVVALEREYFDYTKQSKSVLKGEACDILGGEFCLAPYKRGVY
ncbi:Light-regulated protein 1, chloroplastic-like protein [Drosera capensis]